MRPGRQVALATVVAGAVLALWMVVTALLVGSALGPEQRQSVAEVLMPHLALLVMSWAFALALVAAVLRAAARRYVAAPARLLEQARVLVAARGPQQIGIDGGTAELQALAGAINELAAQRDALRADMAARVAQASQGVERERNRLAALMSELSQSVVVCNLDGRIILYNNLARLQFRALSSAPSPAGGAELIGIGRSIYSVFDRHLVAHALEGIQQRLERGAAAPCAQFITVTRSGQLLRAQMAPVRETESGGGIGGFVLMLENVTRSFEEEDLRDRLLHGLTEGSRSSLGNMQAALDMLSLPDTDERMRERFLGVVREELGAMSRRITDLAERTAAGVRSRWPMEDMLGSDFLAAARRRIEAPCRCPVTSGEVDEDLWLRVESFTLIQALRSLGMRLVDECEVTGLQLRLRAVGGRAQLDLAWQGQALRTEQAARWESEPMRFGEQGTPLSVRDVVERHGGEIWLERQRGGQEAFFRFLLPLAGAGEQADAAPVPHIESRPEYYDFDLFAGRVPDTHIDDTPLARLAFTVFDTETTGLEPTGGDEIIQIGAVRIVNGKLLAQERFEQLVDPGRAIPAASIAIHGITPAMVSGKPRIEEVLRPFHTYAQDTVLVAHNAAFDMKFLQLLEPRTGLSFVQPVLDTLLLSAVAHPHQESHRLEAIAARFNIAVLARHTALGDATVTAEVLLRLIPLLAGMGIHTLRQAREAAQRTYYAKISY